MPKRTDIRKVLVIGSGPIVIGQAAEFDYAGTQACLALKEEGYEVILCNSNPATIMTDTSIADKVYMEPLTLEYIAKIIRYERPDAILPGIGGQTGLNLAMQLEKKGVLAECRVELLGTRSSSIEQAEDREKFKVLCEQLGEPVLPSDIAASVVAQWSGVAVMVAIIVLRYGSRLVRVTLREILDMKAMRQFFSINGDIIVRTFCLVAVYTFFTKASADMGDGTILAVNTILLQLFTLFSYMNDGFAYAAEALTGRFIGARDVVSLRRCIKLCVVWCMAVSVIFVGAYVGWWQEIFSMIATSKDGDITTLLATAEEYIGWIIVIPIASAMPFVMDGIMVGATRSRIMRNSMIYASLCYFAILYGLGWLMGNNAIWLAFTSYMFLRGLFQYLMSNRLRSIYAEAERPLHP